jgi:hypothetical protein
MILGVRRLLAVLAIGVALLIGAPSVFAAAASPSPTPTATSTGTAAPTGGASATAAVDPEDDGNSTDNTPDTAPDNSRMLWLLGGAGVVAIGAAAIVIARR